MFTVKPVAGATVLPRNYGQGPGYFSLNFRVSRVFGFGPEGETGGRSAGKRDRSSGLAPSGESGLHSLLHDASTSHRYNITIAVQARNILNHVNPGLPVGNLGSAFFGQSLWLASSAGPDDSFAGDNRRIQLQFRFSF
jgi:hypothetical protein